jgi:anti-anti-sigma factor
MTAKDEMQNDPKAPSQLVRGSTTGSTHCNMHSTTFLLDVTGLDEHMAETVTDRIIDFSSPLELRLDFRKVEWITSAALSCLVALNRRLAEAKGRLILENVGRQVAEVIRVSRLDRVLDVRRAAA